jgi:NADH:ubiquinone oxidoreductase subunit 5 (subunit L)/multisubunit Na+/H+ antiporter MnhA subunit
MIHAIFFGELPAGHANLDEHIDWMTLPPLALSILCIIIGIFPEVGLIIVRAAAQALVGLI